MDGAANSNPSSPRLGSRTVRSRSGSLSEGSTRTRGRPRTLTTVSTELQAESGRMEQVAAAASEKAAAHQRKMTDYLGRQVPPPSGAGELPSGPCGSAVQARIQERTQEPQSSGSGQAPTAGKSATEAAVSQLLQKARQQSDASAILQAVDVLNVALGAGAGGERASPAPGTPAAEPQGESQQQQQQQDREEGGWQTWTNKKTRRIGSDLGEHSQRQVREKTPFQLPGRSMTDRRGYYSSANQRNVANANSRSSRPSAVAHLSDRQWRWFKRRLCLGCGNDHQVKDCPQLTLGEARALLRAAWSCPEDMRPGDRSAPRSLAPRTAAAGSAAAGSAGSNRGEPSKPSATSSSGTSAPMAPSASKRDRETTEKTGLTPEAKKAKMFSDAAKSGLTLYVREKDGAPLSKERFLALKTSFTYYVEDMLANNKDPPLCSGRWQESRSVVKIPMATEEDVLWMRCFLEKAYLVQTEKEFRESRNPIYVAFLKDRLEPEFTGMRQDKLARFIGYYKRKIGIKSLFELKMAAKTTRGKAVHLIMDEEAEELFVQHGCKIPFAAAGWIYFEERQAYVARIKAQERDRMKPKASGMERGQATEGVDKMTIGEDEVEVIDLVDKEAAPAKEKKSDKELQEEADKATRLKYARMLFTSLTEAVKEGKMDQEEAEKTMLEETGMQLGEVSADTTAKRTTSGSSWSEEVEHMHKLDKSALPEVEEEMDDDNDVDDDNDDQAQFELRQERNAQVGHRAAGSGPLTEGAAGSPCNKN